MKGGRLLLANLGIISFLTLATALGIAETELVAPQNKRDWRAWGAPLGMSEWWQVFGEKLRPINWHSTAIIEFADGSLKNYEFPRTGKMPLSERFIKGPERVFFGEQMANLANKKFLPSIARYLARANFDPDNRPRYLTFVIHTAEIPPPDPRHWTFIDRLPHHTFSQTYFFYKVQPDDYADLIKH